MQHGIITSDSYASYIPILLHKNLTKQQKLSLSALVDIWLPADMEVATEWMQYDLLTNLPKAMRLWSENLLVKQHVKDMPTIFKE